MPKKEKDNFSLVDLDDGFVRAAIEETVGRSYTDEEIENIALDQASESSEFREIEQLHAQGLENYPFKGQDVFIPVDDQGNEIIPSDIDVLKHLSAQFVRREMVFFELDKLDKPITRADLAIVVYTRVRAKYPNFEIGTEKLKSLMDALTNNPTADPGLTIPVWNGRVAAMPGNTARLKFDGGMYAVNAWTQPAFRSLHNVEPDLEVFDRFLSFIFKNSSEKEVFLDWLSWCLQNEADKPSWAIFLFSERHGTGKSTLASIVKKLFGEDNSSEQQGIKPIISRFNKPVLLKKLIYAEEVKVAQNSDDGNRLKTLISERQTMAESKGKDIEPIDHRCCFILTTNHKPIWLEAGDRRFYIIHVDHQGYAAGGSEYDTFIKLVTEVQETYASELGIAKLYRALMQRQQAAVFNPYSLNVNELATEVMQEINVLAPDVVEELLAEFLQEHQIRFVPVRYANKLLSYFAHRNPNAAKYSFDRLGWKKKKFAWGGQGSAHAFYHPEANPARGILMTPHGEQSIETHLNRNLAPALNEIGFGIKYEYLDRDAKKPADDPSP
ncbi:primase-helicase family protein [Nereida sp. NH-UV-3]|uniref:primase-helicase family protein n=1 Tax=Nereida TaxID=282198 RepID=UPI0036F3C2BE